MDPVTKARWIEALRSGKYQQGHNSLRGANMTSEFRYCCLGVLCDIVDPSKWDDPSDSYMNYRTHLPNEIRNELGVSIDNQNSLILMNDGCEEDGLQPYTFTQIADWIEASL